MKHVHPLLILALLSACGIAAMLPQFEVPIRKPISPRRIQGKGEPRGNAVKNDGVLNNNGTWKC